MSEQTIDGMIDPEKWPDYEEYDDFSGFTCGTCEASLSPSGHCLFCESVGYGSRPAQQQIRLARDGETMSTQPPKDTPTLTFDGFYHCARCGTSKIVLCEHWQAFCQMIHGAVSLGKMLNREDEKLKAQP